MIGRSRRWATVVAVLTVSATLAGGVPARGADIPDPGGYSGDRRTPGQLGKRLGFNSIVGSWDSGVSPALQASLIKRAGGTVHRFGVSWAEMQPRPGPPAGGNGPATADGPWSSDRVYTADLAAGILPVISIVGAPGWATDFTFRSCEVGDVRCLLDVLGVSPGPPQPPDARMVGEYREFVTWLASRYPLAVIETWNEPNEGYFWGRAEPDPELMGRMQCAAYDAIKAQRPQQLVSSPGLGVAVMDHPEKKTLSYKNFVEPMYKAMGRVCWDILSVHMYIGGPPYDTANTQVARQMSVLRSTRSAAGDRKPIWVGETGLTTSNPNQKTSWAQQVAAQIDGVHKLLTIAEIKTVLIHTLRDGAAPDYANSPDRTPYAFGVLSVVLDPKPGYCHWVQLAGNTYRGC